MIDRRFWERVAGRWSTRDDGIVTPDIQPIDERLELEEDISDVTDELDDILSDIEF